MKNSEKTSTPSVFERLLKDDKIPRFYAVRFAVEKGIISDIVDEVDKTIDERGVLARIKPGQRIAITGGSREINHMALIICQLANRIKQCGAVPFIVPAMGSHGGASAEGQAQILEGYGITGDSIGVEVISSMETVQIGITQTGIPVYIDRNAAEADGIVIVGRIKPHTDFRGKYESGLMKMMAIGLGKQYGASICHRMGFSHMAENVYEFGRTILENTNIVFGLGIIEDIYHNTYKIEAVPSERILEEEPKLLEIAKRLIPGIPFKKIDALFVQEIGKDISGAGMDPNITGRSGQLGISQPYAQRIAICDITYKSHNNGSGLGFADVTTQRAFEKFDFNMTYPNGLTSCDPKGISIPPVMPNDMLAYKFAIHTCTNITKKSEIKIVWIKNTCAMEYFFISEALVNDAKLIPELEIVSDSIDVEFDKNGNVPMDLFNNYM